MGKIRYKLRIPGKRKLEELIPRPCVTCGEPVIWMTQHKECWRKERESKTPEELLKREHLLCRNPRRKGRKSDG